MIANVRVIRGLPITVEFDLLSCGTLDEQSVRIVEIAGREVLKKEQTKWILNRLTNDDWESIVEACYEVDTHCYG